MFVTNPIKCEHKLAAGSTRRPRPASHRQQCVVHAATESYTTKIRKITKKVNPNDLYRELLKLRARLVAENDALRHAIIQFNTQDQVVETYNDDVSYSETGVSYQGASAGPPASNPLESVDPAKLQEMLQQHARTQQARLLQQAREMSGTAPQQQQQQQQKQQWQQQQQQQRPQQAAPQPPSPQAAASPPPTRPPPRIPPGTPPAVAELQQRMWTQQQKQMQRLRQLQEELLPQQQSNPPAAQGPTPAPTSLPPMPQRTSAASSPPPPTRTASSASMTPQYRNPSAQPPPPATPAPAATRTRPPTPTPTSSRTPPPTTPPSRSTARPRPTAERTAAAALPEPPQTTALMEQLKAEQAVQQQQQRDQRQQAAIARRAEAAAPPSLPAPIPSIRPGVITKGPAANNGAGGAGGRGMRLVFVAAEVAPWSKTGGLGDVMGALPAALAARGHQVMVVAPRYLDGEHDDLYEAAAPAATAVGIDLWDGGFHSVDLLHQKVNGVDHVWVDHPAYHRPGCTPYGSGSGPFEDNLFRFSLLSMAACEAPLLVQCVKQPNDTQAPYGEDVVFIANDWHTALVPLYVDQRLRTHGVYKRAASALMLHNLAHQGQHHPSLFPTLGLPGTCYPTFDWISPMQEQSQNINVLKAGVLMADVLVTVSQGYALEVCSPDHGMGLHSLVLQRKQTLRGIVNGIDTNEWNPWTDPFITPHNFGAEDMSGKAAVKMLVQKELGLPVRPECPLLVFVGRLDFQKGPDVILDSLTQLVALDCQVVMLGSGAPDYEERLRAAEEAYPEYCRGWVGFSSELAHRLMAAGDMLLMPSRFEPCGLTQLYAMRYGTIPVVHATGGLKDTIEEYNPFAADDDANLGTGWTFAPCRQDAFLRAVEVAVDVFQNAPKRWKALQMAAMARDSGWARSAAQYEALLMEVAPGVAGASGTAAEARAAQAPVAAAARR